MKRMLFSVGLSAGLIAGLLWSGFTNKWIFLGIGAVIGLLFGITFAVMAEGPGFARCY
jgi:hypothetical protein